MKKLQVIVFIALIAVIIGGSIYYFNIRDSKDTEEEFDYHELFVFEIKDETIPDIKKDEFFERFLNFRQILSADPDNFNIWVALGSLYKVISDYEMAEQVWLYATELRPNNSLTYANLGDLYTNFLKDKEKAEENLLIAMKNSEGEAVNVNYSRQLFELYYYHYEDNEKTESYLLQRIEKYPDEVEFYSLLAYFYRLTDQNEKAIANYEKVLEFIPDDESVKIEIEKLKKKL